MEAAGARPGRRAAEPGPPGGPDGRPARGKPQRLLALGRQPRARPRPGRAADRAGERRRRGWAAPPRGRPARSPPPGAATPGPARHPTTTRPARLTPRHDPEPAKGASAAKAAGGQQEPPARVAVQTVGHGGPERAESSPEPTQAPEHAPEPQAGQGRTEHHQAEPVAREPGRERGHQAEPEHDAASEPSRGQAASPFAQARPEPEPEAGE